MPQPKKKDYDKNNINKGLSSGHKDRESKRKLYPNMKTTNRRGHIKFTQNMKNKGIKFQLPSPILKGLPPPKGRETSRNKANPWRKGRRERNKNETKWNPRSANDAYKHNARQGWASFFPKSREFKGEEREFWRDLRCPNRHLTPPSDLILTIFRGQPQWPLPSQPARLPTVQQPRFHTLLTIHGRALYSRDHVTC